MTGAARSRSRLRGVARSDPRFQGLSALGVKPAVAAALERWTTEGSDEDVVHIDALQFAKRHGLDETDVIDGFVHAAKVGLYEMTWNLVCPGCGGILEGGKNLKSVRKETYGCSMCVDKYEPSLDEMVEVSFTVSPTVRRVPAHDPDSLPFWDYYRLVYYGTVLEVPRGEEWSSLVADVSLEADEIPPHGKVIFGLQAPPEFLILFDPVTHGTTLIDVKGEPTRERTELRVALTQEGSTPESVEIRPGPLRLTIENKTDHRALPSLFRANDRLHDFLKDRKPFLTAKRLFTNQTFRDVYRTEMIEIDQRLRITSLTVLFTDLKGSTDLYENVGDLAAYDLVRSHFGVLGEVVRSHAGAVVKTIGDAVMATFPTPEQGLAAAIDMRTAMDAFRGGTTGRNPPIKIGLHEGPCVAVVSNERLDYFGQTVNVAARVQRLAGPRGIVTTAAVAGRPEVVDLLAARGLHSTARAASLQGIRGEMTVYEIA